MAINIDQLKAEVEYVPETGRFHWLVSKRGVRAGSEAGFQRQSGYREIRVSWTLYRAHRLAWFYMTGEWPKESIDHINGDKSDNRWANLRLANKSQNAVNYPRKNKTGFRGVSRTASGKYGASSKKNYKSFYLGSFDTPEAAHSAYCDAAKKMHGAFARAA